MFPAFLNDTTPHSLINMQKSSEIAKITIDDSLRCNRYFLGEFEELNTVNMENHKLSYAQDITGKKGFQQ